MSNALPQSSFTSGELAPNLYGRVDFARYYSGLKTCRNIIVSQFGGVFNRSGSRYCVSAKDMTKRVRLVPFQFSASQQYVIEFGHLYARIIYNGALVVDAFNAPIVLTTPYNSSDLITVTDIDLLRYIQSADVMTLCIQTFQPQQLKRTSATSWALSAFVNTLGPFKELNTLTSQTVKSTATTGSVTLTSNADIFLANHVGLLFKIEQMPDNITPSWEVAVPIAVNNIIVAGANYYQALTSGTTGTVRPTVTEGTQKDGNTGVLWQYLHSSFGIVQITAFTNTKTVTAQVVRRLPDSLVTSTSVKTITGLVPGNSPSNTVPVRITITSHGFINGSSVTITGVTGTTGANGTHQIIVIDSNTFDLANVYDSTAYINGGTASLTLTATDSYKWALEAWGSSEGYPMSVGFYQQRQIFAATLGHPQTQWYSRVTGYTDFGTSVPVLDDDALTFTLFSRKINEIRHIVELTALILFTSDGPFVVNSGKSGVEALTPTTMSVKRQGQNGVSHIPPVLIDEGALFVQEKGDQVRSLGYSFQQDAFVGQDITILSNHLFRGRKIVDWTYQEKPNSVVWCVRDDGVLLGLTYLPKQEVVAWHRHDTDGKYESVCCITENNKDVLYAAVKRTVNGASVRYIERFDTRDFTDIRDCFFLDCGLSYDGRNTTTTTMTVSGGTNWDETETLTITASASFFSAGNVGSAIHFTDTTANIVYRLNIVGYTSGTVVTAIPNRSLPSTYQNVVRTDWGLAAHLFTGLGHLEGKTVSVLADGLTQVSKTVTDGSITLDRPAVVVHAGLPYTSDMETLEISNSQTSIRDKKQLIKQVSLIVNGSTGIQAGTDFDHLMEYKARQFENYDQATFLQNKIVDINVPTIWQKAGLVCVRQDKPLPLEVLSVIPQVDIGGI